MRNTESDAELYLLVDIDDFLVFSSDKLQTIVNEKTNFKTETLQMLEQLKRNCRYLVSEVRKECNNAQKENRKPSLGRFLVFDDYANYDLSKLYTKPIEASEYYLWVANKLLEQFLEERDTFLEIDNMPKGQRKYFSYEKELATIIDYSEYIDNNKEAFHKINEFCLQEMVRLILEAKKKNNGDKLTIPEYGELVSMDTNDIIKKGSIDDSSKEEYVLYKKPLQNITNCIKAENRLNDIVTNARVFYQPSKEIVDYSAIHSIANVNWDAVTLVEGLIHSGTVSKVYFSTHHNGDREEQAKIRLMHQIIPEANGFIGQRFHDEEHDAKRRGRSSKTIKAAYKLHIMPDQVILLDDSKANCEDCIKQGGTAILYKPETDSEKINGKIEETGYNRIIDLTNNNVDGIIAVSYVKQKRKK